MTPAIAPVTSTRKPNAVHSRISAKVKRAASPPSPDPSFDPSPDSVQDCSATARTLAGSTPPPGALHGCFYARFAIVLPCVPLIVSAAAQAQILNGALATHSPWIHVVEL